MQSLIITTTPRKQIVKNSSQSISENQESLRKTLDVPRSKRYIKSIRKPMIQRGEEIKKSK